MRAKRTTVAGAKALAMEDIESEIDDEDLARVVELAEEEMQGRQLSAGKPQRMPHWAADILSASSLGAYAKERRPVTALSDVGCLTSDSATHVVTAADGRYNRDRLATAECDQPVSLRGFARQGLMGTVRAVQPDEGGQLVFAEEDQNVDEAPVDGHSSVIHGHPADTACEQDKMDESPAGIMCLYSKYGPCNADKSGSLLPIPEVPAAPAVGPTAPCGFEVVSAAFLADILGQDIQEFCDLVFDQGDDGVMQVGASVNSPVPALERQEDGNEGMPLGQLPPSGTDEETNKDFVRFAAESTETAGDMDSQGGTRETIHLYDSAATAQIPNDPVSQSEPSPGMDPVPDLVGPQAPTALQARSTSTVAAILEHETLSRNPETVYIDAYTGGDDTVPGVRLRCASSIATLQLW